MNQENLEYLKKHLGQPTINTYLKVRECKKSSTHNTITTNELMAYREVKKYLKFMDKFQDNKWWLTGNHAEIAYYQIHNKDCMLISFSKYKRCLKKMLKRDISVCEIVANNCLQTEVERVYYSLYATAN